MKKQGRRFTDKNGVEYIAATDAARIMGRHVSSLYRHTQAGNLVFVRFGGGGGRTPSFYLSIPSLRDYYGPLADKLG